MASQASAVADLLGPQGLLAEHIAGFRCRRQQQAMAEAVAETIADGSTLICEAGTGTGKTFAYLVPALTSGRKVIISTGTRNLQDQLFHRDIPTVRDALGQPLRIALLKGRGNYLCRHRLEAAAANPIAQRPEVRRDLRRVSAWSADTATGDIAELALPEDAPIWPVVTSTSDNCLGQNCPSWSRCHLVEARRRAQDADVVVINHHLLCADIALREEGFGEVLPGADCIIVDEAHQLPEVATGFFGTTVSSRQVLELARDVVVEYRREAGDMPELPRIAEALTPAVQELRACLGETDRRAPWQAVADDGAVMSALADLDALLDELSEALQRLSGRGKGLDHCLARTTAVASRLALLLGEEADAQVRWLDVRGRGFRLNQTPLDVADIFRAYRERHRSAWVLTSATLAVGRSFEHFASQIGVDDARTACWDSPFEYARQALWFVPRGMPDPADPVYGARCAELTLDLLDISGGRAFLLFTSHRALREAVSLLEGRLRYPMLVQGTAPRAELIERFRAHGDAVLLGTSSFWEGVDVRGDALSCVIIDRLPFASPGDPILQARLDVLRRRGGNPFREHQLPRAVIALKQGAGRLIRDASDRGVLVVCDPRLLGRSYGRAFLDSLPPMARSRDIEDVRAFFGGQDAPAASETESAVREPRGAAGFSP
ncbi:MAG: ATP-dependent DNA helicase [Thiohalocapsa sp.]|nr:ATP-dependent DNA helicase [Thiohalocapsa sp.]